ncbi:TolC family protein [Bowmanella denitrificans]|uniref:TolC family protein n=1 Tax=Bowmanella denitrificans TaxID=366582 RepID=A0ABP3HGX8_9ALTE
MTNSLIKMPLAALAVAVLSACAVGPDYRAPELIATELTDLTANVQSGVSQDPLWWRQFDDPQLNQLIEATLKNNPSLAAARANVDAAYAQFMDISNDILPSGDIQAVHQAQNQLAPGMGDQRVHSRSFRLGAQLNWTVDLFGKLRRATEAAEADAKASEQAWRDIRINLLSQVANQYATSQALSARVAVAKRNLQSLARTRTIIQARLESGYASQLDLLRIDAQVKGVEASIPALQAQAERSRNSLLALAGGRQKLTDWQWLDSDLPQLNKPVAIEQPQELLRQRPDVQLAERRLASATARIGVAQAAQYPELSVNGFLGYLSLGGTSPDSQTRAWSLAPSLSWPGLDLSSVQAQIDIANAREREALANLQGQWLGAVADAQSALSDYSKSQQQTHLLEAQVLASQQALELAQLQYDAGAIELLDLLDSERTLLAARDNLVQAQNRTFVALSEVYRAFGGRLTPDAAHPLLANRSAG